MRCSIVTHIFTASLTSAFCLGVLHADTEKSAEKKKPLVEIRQSSSIYNGCDIIEHRGEHTIIPKGSILYIPERLKARVSVKPDGKFLFWPAFLKRNQNWIWTYEVTQDQARGKASMPAQRMEEFVKLGRMVIATNQRNPIAVFPPQQEEKEKTGKAKTNKE